MTGGKIAQAADADLDCDASVIPIPYFDKNPDGSFREVHDEADKYPAYVPITKYDEFDFGVHRSDMKGNTEAFLKKIKFIFDIFQGREDACLIWRSHPLLESIFDSMRKEYKPVYEALKTLFIEDDIGILDETPDIEKLIVLSDDYIGDSGTSVTSLFGVAGWIRVN